MTWTGYFVVQDVSDGPAPIDVLLTAHADKTVKPFRAHGGDYAETEQPALASNTEGRLAAAKLTLVFDEDEAPLAVGDLVHVQGHFDKRS